MKNEMALDLRTGALVKLKSPESLIKEYKTNTTDTKENTEMTRKKKDILLLQFDGGNGCTKIYYEIPTKDGKVKKVQKVVKSCIDIVADADDTYTLNGLTKVNGVAYNFNTSKSVIEKSKENKKHNEYHFGLIARELDLISDEIKKKQEKKDEIYKCIDATTFNVSITTPLDAYNEMLSDVKSFYEKKKHLVIEKDGVKKNIEIKHVEIRPELISAINFIGKEIKVGTVFINDLGGLNNQYIKLEDFKTDFKELSYVGENGYAYIIDNLPNFMRNNSTKSYKDADIIRYIESVDFGNDKEKDSLIHKFFNEVYVPLLIKDLDKKSISLEYDKIYFIGGTSEKFRDFIEEGFKKNGAKNITIVNNAILANAIGAYKKAKVEIEKLEKQDK